MRHLTAGIKVWRNEDYIWHVLYSIYELVDRIAIAFGPVPVMKIWKPDNTLQKILEFPDPDKKIVLRVADDWHSITSMVNWTYAQAKDLYFKVDGDEIISPELADEIRSRVRWCDEIGRCIVMGNKHFLRSFQREIIKSTIDPWRLRIFRVSSKYKWRHPDFVPGVWDTPTAPGLRLKNPIFHYPYVMSYEKIIIKLSYHLMNWRRLGLLAAVKEAKQRIIQLRDETYPWKYKTYDGEHPKILDNHPFRNTEFPWIVNDSAVKEAMK